MQEIFELSKILLPAALALYMIYLVVKAFLNKQFQEHLAKMKVDNNQATLPLRLQAYERMVIFMERIAPSSIIVRLNDQSYNVAQFQYILVNEIRQEYMHNLSQQIYMSNEAWNLINKAREDVISKINQSADELEKEAPSLQLAKAIIDRTVQAERDTVGEALYFIKNEVQTLFP